MRAANFFFPLFILAFSVVRAQSPAPIIVQAATANPTISTASAPATSVGSIPDAIKSLEKIKAANDEVLAKQKAALERLEELQQAADELRIFAKRG
jgi:hypothetical protein